ncbi:MAG TPA: ATP-binding cassette domain-containing protein [Clostridiales bacterium]|nr:ATP-binding cassette domain-containing protein [Clostridiales bacterium]
MLELRNVNWTLPTGEVIIEDLSLVIPGGKLSVVTGPNGGGKTTLAKLIAGLVTPTSGRIYLDGEDITDLDITERARLGISFGFQTPVRFKGMTVQDLLETASGRALSFDEVCDLTGKVGLCTLDYIDRDVDTSLSGGEIKRVEIASVLARGTQVSLFDEPEAGIDMWSFNGLVEVFKNLKEQGKTMMIISHQQRLLEIADEIIVLSAGHLRDQGPTAEVMPGLLAGEIAGHCPVGRKESA